MGQIVLTDASPIVYLARLDGGLSWLKEIFVRVSMTPTVSGELLPNHDVPGKAAIESALASGVLAEIEAPWLTPDFPGLDPDEESTLRAAVNLVQSGSSVLVLIDEKDGRRALEKVQSTSLVVSGTAAVVSRARELGLIVSAIEVFEELRRLGFRVSDQVVRRALVRAGENPQLWPPVESTKVERSPSRLGT